MTYGTDGLVTVAVNPDTANGEVALKKGSTVIATGTVENGARRDRGPG